MNGCEAGNIHLEIMMNPHDIQMEDMISNIFSDTITGVSNMKYLNAPQIIIDHREEGRKINHALREDIVVEGDGIDLELKDLG